MRVYLIRHTMPQVPDGTCYGHADVPLVAHADAIAQVRDLDLGETEARLLGDNARAVFQRIA